MEIIREISNNELLYIDAQAISSSFYITFLFECDRSIPIQKLENAVNKVKADVDAKKVKNYWVKKEEKLKVCEVYVEKPIERSKYITNKADVKKGTLEVTVINKRFILFRIAHGMCDGKGALMFVENVFRAMAGKPVIQLRNDINDKQFVKSIENYRKRVELMPKYKIKNVCTTGNDFTVGFEHFYIEGHHHQVVARIAKAIMEEFESETVRYLIPVDLRKHKAGSENIISNMVLPYFLFVNKNESIEQINQNFIEGIKNNGECNTAEADYYHYEKMPEFCRQNTLKFYNFVIDRSHHVPIGAPISYLGRVKIEDFGNEDFDVINFYDFPVHIFVTPFTIIISEYNEKTMFSITYYTAQVSHERICTLIKRIVSMFGVNENNYKHLPPI